MPWNEVTQMSLKIEFVRFALLSQEPFNHLCRRFNISPKTGYKLLRRYKAEGESGLIEKSRRPLSSPYRTSESIENKIVNLRKEKPYWGARKIHAYLSNKGHTNLPAISTITGILNRYNLIEAKETPAKAGERFEHAAPNDLWQADFKGHFKMHDGRCHPLTILDDHSRFSIGLRACDRESTEVVKSHFIEVFEEYGLPYRINFDNGSPWASKSYFSRHTEFSIWLIRLGVKVSYSKVRRPQTNGKDERFHRTLKNELLQYHYFKNLKDAQKHFDRWRNEYNFDRPHEAIELKPPISRYKCSTRKYPGELPEINYPQGYDVRNVDMSGKISYKNKKIFISEGLRGLPVALHGQENNQVAIYFCDQKILSINLKDY